MNPRSRFSIRDRVIGGACMGGAVLRASDFAFQDGLNGLLQTHFKLGPTGARSFQGEITRSYVSPVLRLADIGFTPHTTRLKGGKRPCRKRSFLISHQVEGTSWVAQGGRETVVGPNQIFFIDTSHPFEIETDTIRTRSVYLDEHYWRESFPERDRFTATALRCDTGFGNACSGMIDTMFAMPWDFDDRGAHRLAACLANLLAVAALSQAPAGLDTPRTAAAEGALARIRQVIHRHLADPDLDCTRIATEVGLSLRQLHAVFSATGTSVMRYILVQRLTRIAAALENPALADRPVSAIAFDWGFNEAAHFSRQFKAHFGIAPARYRVRALGQTGAALLN